MGPSEGALQPMRIDERGEGITSSKDAVSGAALIIANLIPLAGVLFLGWKAVAVVALYWIENVIVGFYSILKLALWSPEGEQRHPGPVVASLFFFFHFGAFCAYHAVMIYMIFGLEKGLDILLPERAWSGSFAVAELIIWPIKRLLEGRPDAVTWAILALFASHGISFMRNYVSRKEYVSATMAKPYPLWEPCSRVPPKGKG